MFDGYKRFNIQNATFTLPFSLSLIRPYWPHLWRLLVPVSYEWDWDLGHQRLTVPLAYECDGASIPFVFYNVVDPITAIIGAFLHDMLYETQCGVRPLAGNPLLAAYGDPVLWTDDGRGRADALLFNFWLASGMSHAMAMKGYIGVRIGGEKPWEDEEMVPIPVKYEALVGDRVPS